MQRTYDGMIILLYLIVGGRGKRIYFSSRPLKPTRTEKILRNFKYLI